MRLVYSPEDNGWYWEDYSWRTSQIFPTETAARQAKVKNQIIWS